MDSSSVRSVRFVGFSFRVGVWENKSLCVSSGDNLGYWISTFGDYSTICSRNCVTFVFPSGVLETLKVKKKIKDRHRFGEGNGQKFIFILIDSE